MMYSRILAVVIVVAATLWIGSGVFGRTEAPAEARRRRPRAVAQPLFQVAVDRGDASKSIRAASSLSGRTEADNRASAIARTAGSIVELKVERGDRVKEGDVIATLSDEAREAQVARGARRWSTAAQTDLEAKLQLIKRGIIAANEKNQLEADLRAAEAALAMAKAEHERGLVRAPISGVVSDVSDDDRPGDASANMMVAEVIALDPMLAVAEVAERQLGEIKVGDQADVRLVTGQTAEGQRALRLADRERAARAPTASRSSSTTPTMRSPTA